MIRSVSIVLFSIVFLFGSIAAMAASQQYVCPMHPDYVSDKPGTCPRCGMTLELKGANNNVAILLFDGVQIIDYTAPYEIFGQQHLHVFTVAETKKAIKTSMDMSVNPDYTFADSPAPFILVLPGGTIDSAVNKPQVINWIKKNAPLHTDMTC